MRFKPFVALRQITRVWVTRPSKFAPHSIRRTGIAMLTVVFGYCFAWATPDYQEDVTVVASTVPEAAWVGDN
jgi:hypothetical protein